MKLKSRRENLEEVCMQGGRNNRLKEFEKYSDESAE